MYGKLPLGASSSNCTVLASVAFAESFDSTPARVDSALEPFFGSASALIEAATSCAVIGVPSWNFTPWRILNVHTLPSELGFQLSARRGCSCSLLSDHERNSPVCDMTPRPPSSATLMGSISVVGPGDMPSFSVPPGLTATSLPPALTAVSAPPPLLVLLLPVPHALTRNPRTGTDMPITVPRRTNSRRLRRPAVYSSMTWFSSSLLCARIASTRRVVSSRLTCSPPVPGSAPPPADRSRDSCAGWAGSAEPRNPLVDRFRSWISVPETERERPYRRPHRRSTAPDSIDRGADNR